MRIKKTKFKDLLIYEKDTFNDKRGYFRELYLQKHFKTKFPFDVMSYSKRKQSSHYKITNKLLSKLNSIHPTPLEILCVLSQFQEGSDESIYGFFCH